MNASLRTMQEACHAVGILPPRRSQPGRWTACPVDGKGQANGSGRVLDKGDRGMAWNWITGERAAWSEQGEAEAPQRALSPAERERLAQQDAEERAARVKAADEAARVAQAIVKAARPDVHPYLARKGFPEELGLVVTAPWSLMTPEMAHAASWLAEGPLLIVPGRHGQRIVTVQMIDVEGVKHNLRGGTMRGVCHRIATGRETWVAEGIATALTVRAALRLLGRSATVLSAFAASNVRAVAETIDGARIAADHDKPLSQLGGLGTGEFYAAASGRPWTMPPIEGNDFNDMHQRDGLRAVALHLREAGI